MKKIVIDDIKKIVFSILEVENITIEAETDLTAIGMDSLEFIRIVELLENKYKCEIADEKLFIPQMNTLKKISEVLQETLDNNSNEMIKN